MKTRLALAGAIVLVGGFAAPLLAAEVHSTATDDPTMGCTRKVVKLDPAASAIITCPEELAWGGTFVVPGKSNNNGKSASFKF